MLRNQTMVARWITQGNNSGKVTGTSNREDWVVVVGETKSFLVDHKVKRIVMQYK
jgi:hypothetical protein